MATLFRPDFSVCWFKITVLCVSTRLTSCSSGDNTHEVPSCMLKVGRCHPSTGGDHNEPFLCGKGLLNTIDNNARKFIVQVNLQEWNELEILAESLRWIEVIPSRWGWLQWRDWRLVDTLDLDCYGAVRMIFLALGNAPPSLRLLICHLGYLGMVNPAIIFMLADESEGCYL